MFHLKFVADAPDSGDGPVLVVFDFFTEALDVNVHRPGIAHVFIAPDVIQQLLPGENLIGRGCEEIEKL